MSAPSDLTTLANVKAWQGITTTDSDPQISALISASSRMIYSFLGRPSLLPRSWTDRYDGRVGQTRVLLRNWPVISVQSVQAGVSSLSAVDPSRPTIGYALAPDPWGGAPPGAPQTLDLYGGAIADRQGLIVTYTAGHQDTFSGVVPSGGGTIVPSSAYGAWATDQGVVFTNTGAALALVSGTPAAGQYAVSATGTYTFAAADQNAPVSISFGFIPSELGQACVELVAQRLFAGSRVGVKSKSLGGQETVGYDTAGIPDAVKMMLQPYRKVVPL